MENQKMYELIGLLSGYLVLPFLYIIKYYFYEMFLGFKYKPWKFIVYSLLITVVGFSTMKIVPHSLQIVISNVLWLIIICFLCKGNLLIKFYAVIVENTVLLLISLSFLSFDFGLIPIANTINIFSRENMLIYFIKNIINDIIHYSFLFVFLKKISKLLKLEEKQLNLYESLYLLIPCFSTYCLTFVFYIIQIIKIDDKNYYLPYIFPKIYYLLPFICFTLLASILITAYTFKKMLEGEQEAQNNIIMKQQINHSKNLEGIYSGLRSVVHDMNNHIACLKNLAATNNIEDIKNYLHNISETIQKLDFEIKTGNTIADAVINEKNSISKAEGINFICDFVMPKQTILEPMDICIILSNSLDNAIEACAKITDNNIPKTINIKSLLKDMYLIIEISNTTTTKLKYMNNKIISTKPNIANHGIGLSNIKTIVKKYNGVFDIIEEKNKFTINIMLKYTACGHIFP